MRILVAIEPVDLRKGIDGLAQLCREKLGADPRLPIHFPCRRATAIKVLAYDGQGFWMAQKRLSKGRFVWWPTGKEATRTLQAHQAQLLLAAGNPEAEAAPVWRIASSRPGQCPRSRFQLAGFEVTPTGRFWVIPEARASEGGGDHHVVVEDD
jgi:transposase